MQRPMSAMVFSQGSELNPYRSVTPSGGGSAHVSGNAYALSSGSNKNMTIPLQSPTNSGVRGVAHPQ